MRREVRQVEELSVIFPLHAMILCLCLRSPNGSSKILIHQKSSKSLLTRSVYTHKCQQHGYYRLLARNNMGCPLLQSKLLKESGETALGGFHVLARLTVVAIFG